MSHQTGIKAGRQFSPSHQTDDIAYTARAEPEPFRFLPISRANDELKKIFAKCKKGKIRALKVSIVNEQLVCAACKESEKSWDVDFDKMISQLIEDDQPCYILYKLDAKNETTGHDWLLISWSPDDSAVRQKMLYASTKATLKQEFGSAAIKDEIHGTTRSDCTLNAYNRNRVIDRTPAPLTTQEEEMAELRRVQNICLADVAIDTRTPTLSGISFPISNAVVHSIERLKNRRINYIQLKIDMDEEEIHLVKEGDVSMSQLSSQVPDNKACYHLYTFTHKYDGEDLNSVVFIYSMPGYCCSVKERMLYSSCKGPLLDVIESNLGVAIAKKLEVDSGSELTEKFLTDEIHPIKPADKPKFDKPKGPPSRGAKRLTKTNNNN